MIAFFKKPKMMWSVFAIAAIIILGAVCLTSAAEKKSATSQSINEYNADKLTFKLYVFPEKYTPAMSSTPGIRIAPEYEGPIQKVRYTTENGSMLTWDATSGKVTEGGKTVELPYGIPAYWSPISAHGLNSGDNVVTVSLLGENGKIIAEKKLTIICDGFYTVKPSYGIVIGAKSYLKTQEPENLDEAVSLAIKSRATAYKDGETATEGHIILDTEEKDGLVKVYTIASDGIFGFENDVFTKVSGSGAIATVITFYKDENSKYSLTQYREPMDGSYNLQSKKELFPKKLWDKVLSENKYYPDLIKQQEEQAEAYLKTIGREAKVNANYTERKLANINVQASNKLFAEYTKYDAELNNFPYWLGTREIVNNGARYVYETSQTKTSDGFDMIVFKKTKEDGSIVKEYRYKIVGSEPQLLN